MDGLGEKKVGAVFLSALAGRFPASWLQSPGGDESGPGFVRGGHGRPSWYDETLIPNVA